MTKETLLQMAHNAAAFAYVPYSRFRVGAAVLCEDGTVITGANVENRSYGLTICAERTAIVSAVSAGHTSFRALAISTPDADEPVGPCGACRQVIREFAAPEMPVYCEDAENPGTAIIDTTAGALLPFDSLHGLGSPGPNPAADPNPGE